MIYRQSIAAYRLRSRPIRIRSHIEYIGARTQTVVSERGEASRYGMLRRG
jgi:hypothetical protein